MASPLLLVHGFLSTRGAMHPLARHFRRAGREVERARLSPLCIQDVRELAAQVGRSVEALQEVTGAEHVDLVGVSQGGLAALYYVRRLGGTERVRRMVALGTPFTGTWFAALGVPLLGAVSTGVWQSLPDSDLLKELTAAGPTPGEDVVSISRLGDTVAPPERCRLEGARHVVLPGRRTPWTHQTMGISGTVAQAAIDALDAD